jgi:cation:H+ antiporter
LIIFATKREKNMNILLLIGGLILILLGANGLTDGAASVAKRFRIPPIVIGLTIVAFGTSAPELTVSVSSALKGSADIAIGNVVGSNIFNTLMIVGCTALFAPIVITRNTLRKEIPLCILSSIVLLICANDVFLDKAPENILNRVDGLLLLCFFVIFMGYTFAIASKPVTTEQQAEHPVIEEETEIKSLPWWQSILYIIGGLAALIYGGQLFVDGATGIARNLGVSESIIGLTLVAGGTSLPELATSIVAALKKNPEIAIGNVIGSNLFNIFFVLGCSASITPLHLSGITNFDLFTLVGSSILLWLFGLFFAKRTITRIEGAIMILCYVAYTVVLIYNT